MKRIFNLTASILIVFALIIEAGCANEGIATSTNMGDGIVKSPNNTMQTTQTASMNSEISQQDVNSSIQNNDQSTIVATGPEIVNNLKSIEIENLNDESNSKATLNLPEGWYAKKLIFDKASSFEYNIEKNKNIKNVSTYEIYNSKNMDKFNQYGIKGLAGEFYAQGYYRDQSESSRFPNHSEVRYRTYSGETVLGQGEIFILNCDLPREMRTDKYSTYDMVYAWIPIQDEALAYNLSISVPLGENDDEYIDMVKKMLNACSNDSLKNTSEENQIGNIINGGYVAKQGDWIYYSNGGYEPISKSKAIGDEKFTFDYFGGYDINVVDGWIYYIAQSEDNGNEIIKMKTDGTNRTKLLDAQCNFLYVKGKWIYYSVMDTGNLYKAKIDGTNISKISDDNCTFVNVVGDIIFYSNASDNKKIYKLMNDKKTKIIDESSSYINAVGDWIYFINESYNNRLYRAKTNGEEKKVIIDQKCESVNVSGNWIYYTIPDDDNIHKAKLDGTGQEILITNFKTSTPCLSIFEDWIYYFSVADGCKICKIKTDGSNKAVLG